jgi:hypothetical protein
VRGGCPGDGWRRGEFVLKKWSNLGCFYILGMGLVAIALLLINGIVVRSFLQANSGMFADLKWEQAINYFVPVLLIFFEFWVFDLFRRRE